MPRRILRCAIEEIAEWHPQLFLEPHIVAFVAVTGRYSVPPAPFQVECENVTSRWIGRARRFSLEVGWSEETVDKAERLRATMQSRPLVELASVAVGMILARDVLSLGQLDRTSYGDRADYRSLSAERVLEVSGTETLSELGRRHREKVTQALSNPFGWGAYVVVCAFSDSGHRVRVFGHAQESGSEQKKD